MPVRTGQGLVVWRLLRERAEAGATATAPPRTTANCTEFTRVSSNFTRSRHEAFQLAFRARLKQGWTALSRPSQTKSTPRDASQFLRRSEPCSNVTATAREAQAVSTATPRSMLRRSMQAASDLQKRSTGFSRV